MLKILIIAILGTINLAQASTFTHRDLSYSDEFGESVITNSKLGIEYLGLDVLKGLNYAQAQTITSEGGKYEAYSIATLSDVHVFFGSIFSDSWCTYRVTGDEGCGRMSGWQDGSFGNNLDGRFDDFLFESDNGFISDLGFVRIGSSGFTSLSVDCVNSICEPNHFLSGRGWLVVRDIPSPVPMPPTAILLVSGLLGLFFVAYNKEYDSAILGVVARV